MFKKMSVALLGSACTFLAGVNSASAFDNSVPNDPPAVLYQPQVPPAPVRVASNSNMGGGFIEFIFGDGPGRGPAYAPQQPVYQQQPGYYDQRRLPPMGEPQMQDAGLQQEAVDPRQRQFDPKFEKQLVDYSGNESAGTIVVDTPNKFLYLVEGNGRAMRYGIGVGRPGFTWSGVKSITAKREWPAWTPPAEMIARRPDLPRHMEGGPENPLGARAMYLGSTLYRIHGSNEPWTIGTNVSSGCIRMRNEDVIDLYGRVNVGTKVVVM
ncbi:lipoprotein-anchoring transpeptidase ErfK/SrfK [Bradyrhizobium sp. GM2.2]|jgi:lipoprotein-anchoring transpeptidase ErfK/SrfK|uniref:L,D-transpeptidase n=1 Tax=Bradyrhizobium TaxID=374 RepID=UPI0003655726|nr:MULTISPECIES: L,D-transpeptidase [unclassified Bradyrhizobium]MCK1268416.1 L,D-transpeptidase [Bradyrhizobium sp. 84]MCK1291393.1 L,D-transpeptidase [Bradyrhizobium sp. 30]MCK1308456.1 L,D-transpeptidase [Bradyrhizobium sp. 45]MCK1313175.1 L,D-transpeptidase [Bradyrhizobium sp. 23]MCK1320280.1 L,D-transpeptidase [Bradyrhizobium sp. 156]